MRSKEGQMGRGGQDGTEEEGDFGQGLLG